ncbi:hypothetical protein ACFL1D_02900 [Candidatus Omnitrophota bacterium]
MSIIYDALKKVEKKPEDTKSPPQKNEPKPRKLLRIFYILFALAIFSLLSLFVDRPSEMKPLIERSLMEKSSRGSFPPSIPPLPQKRIPATLTYLPQAGRQKPSSLKLPTLYLSGIFASEGEYLALINDRVVGVGDSIENAKIDKIDSDGVNIKFGGSFYRIEYP